MRAISLASEIIIDDQETLLPAVISQWILANVISSTIGVVVVSGTVCIAVSASPVQMTI